MTTYRPYAYRAPGQAPPARQDGTDAAAVLGAVRDDIRQTLRTGWIDPALEAGATAPAFFTAAWSAIRPNFGKSFLHLARAIRTEAAQSARTSFDPPDLPTLLAHELSEEEIRRMSESARSAHLVVPKLQIVVHAMHRIVRRERIPGTGREESPVRRGVPEWQRWMGFQPPPEDPAGLLEEATRALGAPATPGAIRLFARWPSALGAIWDGIRPWCESEPWAEATARLRRLALAGVATLPHPMELQWGALKARGLSEDDRIALLDVMAAFDGAMAAQTLVAAFVWAACGAPEIGVEG